MKKTALFKQHERLGAKMTPFAGFDMPLEYSGVIKEHMAVRERAGIFDVSHMGEFWIKGEGAGKLLQRVTTNDVSKLEVGQAQYTCMPNGKGGIIDDLIVYRYEEQKYMAVVNASNIRKDWEWLEKQNEFGAELEDASDSMALIAVQGPKAKEILQKLTAYDLASIASFRFVIAPIAGGSDVIISSTGYTGAGGFELYCYNSEAEKIWKNIYEAGESEGLLPAGLAARDTLRMEMGYCLYGNDINEETSPIESGLGWIVKFVEGKEFIDKDRLLKQKKEGVRRKLVGIKLQGRGIPRKDYRIVTEDDIDIGFVTSGTMSPVLQKGIGLAYITAGQAAIGNKVFVKVRNKNIEAVIVKLPFI